MEGSYGMYLKPKKNFPSGKMSAEGTWVLADDREDVFIIRGPLLRFSNCWPGKGMRDSLGSVNL